MIDRMTKYSFVLLSGEDKDFLKEIEATGLVDITRSSKPVDEESRERLAKVDDLRKAITKIGGLDFGQEHEAIAAKAKGLPRSERPLEDWKEASARLTDLKAELSSARKEWENVRAWGSFDAKALDALAELGYATRFHCVPKKRFDPSWAERYPLQVACDNGSKVWFVTVSDDKDYGLPVAEVARPELDLKESEAKVKAIEAGMAEAKAKLLSLKDCLPALETEFQAESSALQRHLAGVGADKAAEDMITTFEGFAPEENDAALSAVFDKMGVLYVKESAVKGDNPPIKFKNNRFTRMFSTLTDMYGRPAYDEFDPTPYISVFFLLFFAMCMGDAGYGLILLLIGPTLRKTGMASFSPLVTTLGAATLVMGTVLHTFFGMDISTAPWVPEGLKKCMITGTVFGYDAQMLFSIAIGVVHLCVAFTLKAIYAVKRNGFLNSLGTLGWSLLIVGGVIVGAFAMLNVIDWSVTKVALIALGVVSAVGIFFLNDIHRNPLVNVGSGLYETYNTTTGLLGDVLSYLRLYALGLAGGMLGNAFNSLGMDVMGISVPVVNFIAGGFVLAFGHVLNLAMCCLGAFVHPLRLNFLEFFKNSGYEGTGRAYHPLGENAE